MISDRVVDWVAREILPHEPRIRTRLSSRGCGHGDAEDLLHDAYCRLGELDPIDHIVSPYAYFITIIANLHRQQLRREKIIRFEAITETLGSLIMDEEPDQEGIVGARAELAMVERVLEELPERCRSIFRLRRIDGISQKEIARRLGVTESVVENDATRGLRHLLRTLRPTGAALTDERRGRRRA